MDNSFRLIEEGRKDELWDRHCGYLRMSRADFMEIQRRLMLEQINLLGSSKIGKAFMGERIPSSIEEFRRVTPLTRYSDYTEFLTNRREDDLPVKPYVWARTSGKSSDLGPKWVPYTKTMYDRLSDPVIAALIMSSSSKPGDVKLERHDKFLMASAPPPYVSGYIARSTRDNLEVVFMPPLEEAESMSYGDRVAAGFKIAMREGLDYFMGMSVVLARMGEQFEQQSNNTKPTKDLLNPYILWRLFKAFVKSKLSSRNVLPKDIWKLKGIMTGGTDTEIYQDWIEHYWGRKPLEGYCCTEAGNMAMQAWNYKGMCFFPDNAFLEFIPLEEHNKNKADPSYEPRTILYDELELGIYELVLSNFHGGVFIRYRIGDLFRVVSIRDEDTGSDLPQVRFYSRADDIIDLSSLVRLTERDIWKTIEGAGIKYQDWAARKEIVHGTPTLHLYIELSRTMNSSEQSIQDALSKGFSTQFSDFNSMKEIMGIDPLKVTIIPEGSFNAYVKSKLAAGADLAHLKPPHMKPSDESLKHLLSVSKG
jgi:hypothetical protein